MENSLEKQLVDLYLANADMIAEGLPPLINRPRTEALEVFNLLGLPVRGSANGDRYHYTDLRHAFDKEYEHYFTPSYTGVSPCSWSVDGEHLLFMNGFCAMPEPMTCLDNGVLFGSLAAASTTYPDLVGRHYNRLAGAQEDAMAALNTAFAQDGAFIYVPRGVQVEKPFVITLSHYSEGEAIAGFLRNLFIFEEGSRGVILLDNRSQCDEQALCCQLRELFAAKNSHIEVIELLHMNDRSTLLSDSFCEQQAASRLHTLSMAIGGELIRSDQHIHLEGAAAENHTDGLMLCGAGEHLDLTTDIRHIAPHCTSHELIRGVAADNGTGVFSGRIYVAQHAQQTQAYQQNNNLLLGNEAHIYTKPQLEIYADDVKCSHGATIGQLNDEAIYYMRQRGISEADARRLQLAGFVNQVIDKCPVEEITDGLKILSSGKIEKM